DEFNHDLVGKIIIPQPFGTPKNLYQKESGFCISRFMVIELVVAFLLIAVFSVVARRLRQGGPPRGKMWNFFESILVYIRNEVVEPAIGHHDAHKFAPLLWTVFFFVLFCNLMGLVPWAGSPTASFSTTLALAGVTFATVIASGSMKFGPVGFWLNQVPSMDLPWYFFPLKVVIFVIEVGGLLIRHAILAVRLLANMVAGHVVLLGFMGMAVGAAGYLSLHDVNWVVTCIRAVSSMLFNILELFVAFLQAYIFTFLSALFIGAAVHHH